MSSCEKCWRDAHHEPGDCVPDAYARLMLERKSNPCTPEEQAGTDASRCPKCKRMTLHQHTGECMNGCRATTKGKKNMTDRINALTIVLGEDIREDDVESLCEAIMHMRHVIHVEKNVKDIGSLVSEQRIRQELSTKLWDVLKG